MYSKLQILCDQCTVSGGVILSGGCGCGVFVGEPITVWNNTWFGIMLDRHKQQVSIQCGWNDFCEQLLLDNDFYELCCEPRCWRDDVPEGIILPRWNDGVL